MEETGVGRRKIRTVLVCDALEQETIYEANFLTTFGALLLPIGGT